MTLLTFRLEGKVDLSAMKRSKALLGYKILTEEPGENGAPDVAPFIEKRRAKIKNAGKKSCEGITTINGRIYGLDEND